MPSLRSSHRGAPPSTPDSSIGRPTPRKITRSSTAGLNSSPLRTQSRRTALEREVAALQTGDTDSESDGQEESEEEIDDVDVKKDATSDDEATDVPVRRASKRLRSSSDPVLSSPVSQRPSRAAKTSATKANATALRGEMENLTPARTPSPKKNQPAKKMAKVVVKGKMRKSTKATSAAAQDDDDEFAEVPPISVLENSGEYKLYRSFVLEHPYRDDMELEALTFARGDYVFVRQPGYDPVAVAAKKARRKARQDRKAAAAAATAANGTKKNKKNPRRSTLGRQPVVPDEDDEELVVDALIAEESSQEAAGPVAGSSAGAGEIRFDDESDDEEDEPAPWIARIDRIRGKNKDEVFLLVTWMYTSTEQLKEIRCANIPHPWPRHEIYLSAGHTDYINAQSVEDHAPVVLLDETSMLAPCIGSSEYFYRAGVVKRGKKLRVEPFAPPPNCCNRRFEPSIDHPEQIFVYCPNECAQWYHMEKCQPEPRRAKLEEKRELIEQGLDILEGMLEERRGKELEVGAVTNLEKTLLSNAPDDAALSMTHTEAIVAAALEPIVRGPHSRDWMPSGSAEWVVLARWELQRRLREGEVTEDELTAMLDAEEIEVIDCNFCGGIC